MCFVCIISKLSLLQDSLTYIFAVTTVPADASEAAINHLNATEHQLKDTHG